MGIVYGVGKQPNSTVSSSEVDIVDAIEQAFDKATIICRNKDATATLTLRIQAIEYPDCPDGWFQVGTDISIEPATVAAYSTNDLFGDIKARAVRAGSGDVSVACRTIFRPPIGMHEKRRRGDRM